MEYAKYTGAVVKPAVEIAEIQVFADALFAKPSRLKLHPGDKSIRA
jgi:hypothetical protein